MSEMTFQLSYEGRPSDAPALYAYLVNTDGATVETQNIDEKGVFRFKSHNETNHRGRILIAPEMPDKDPKPTLDELREFNAYEPALAHNRKVELQKIASIPVELWPKWPLCLCRVRGRVEKEFCLWLKDPFCLNFPPFHVCPPHKYCFTLPVCPARVHVCVVKPRLIVALPDLDIIRIRAELLKPVLVKPPFPRDPIGPVIEPIQRHEDSHAHADAPVREAVQGIAAVAVAPAHVEPAHNADPKTEASRAILSPAFRLKLQSESPEVLRRAIAEHLEEIRPLVPYFDWCHLLFTCREIRVVDVDDHGRFDTWFLHDCKDKPDLYFWVEYLYNTEWVTIYRPSLCSGTFWNYDCATEVVLKTTDNRVTGCRPITGRFLEITRVGTGGWLPLVDATTGEVTGLDFGDNTLDPTGLAINSGTYARPFGGVLALNGNFGFNLPDAALATHYRVSFKPSALADVEANWTLINTPLARAYNDTINLGGGASKLVTSSFELKDPTFPDFYRIPKESADQQPEIPSGPDLQDRRWATDEFTIAVLDTDGRALAEGTYDLRIQLCRAPAPGAAPVPVVVPREVFQMPDPANFNQSAFADNAHLIQTPPGGPNANAFRMRLKVDRDVCDSAIADASVDGTVAEPECGMLPRGNNATLGFTASHPQNRATFSFGVVRGNGNDVGANTGGVVSAASSVHGYTRAGTQFSAVVPVSQLFGASECPSAAFAETLNVAAMATNGSHRLSAYDAPERHAAFAIVTP